MAPTLQDGMRQPTAEAEAAARWMVRHIEQTYDEERMRRSGYCIHAADYHRHVKHLLAEIVRLRALNESLEEQIEKQKEFELRMNEKADEAEYWRDKAIEWRNKAAQQSELLSRTVEKATTPPTDMDVLQEAGNYVDRMVRRADGHVAACFPYWHGWALREAYLAGVESERRRQKNQEASR